MSSSGYSSSFSHSEPIVSPMGLIHLARERLKNMKLNGNLNDNEYLRKLAFTHQLLDYNNDDDLIGSGAYSLVFNSPFNKHLPIEEHCVMMFCVEDYDHKALRADWLSHIGLPYSFYELGTTNLDIDFEGCDPDEPDTLEMDVEVPMCLWVVKKLYPPKTQEQKDRVDLIYHYLGYKEEGNRIRVACESYLDAIPESEQEPCVLRLYYFLTNRHEEQIKYIQSDLKKSEILFTEPEGGDLVILDPINDVFHFYDGYGNGFVTYNDEGRYAFLDKHDLTRFTIHDWVVKTNELLKEDIYEVRSFRE